MLFNSFHFILFFIVVVLVYYCLKHKYRWMLLLAASYYFYMCWRPALILLIVFSTFFNFCISWRIYHQKSQIRKRHLLYISLLVNFGLLFLFKYSIFFNESAMALAEIIAKWGYQITGQTARLAAENAAIWISRYPGREFDIILPMGISFYTFQAASYTIDVYRGNVKPVRHYGIFSLFITFFPQLVAGPIERSKNLLPQFIKRHPFRKENLAEGCKLMLLGFFKKIVIADRTAVAVNTVYNNIEAFNGLSIILATLLFTFQIYCDFSGYSDIAMGSAKVMGFQLMSNFEKPFLSKSIKELWRRWHISLSRWFGDYVYIPLGGNRFGKWKQYRNVMITFVVSGLWHGANWTFLIWGGLHGFYQVVGMVTEEFRNRVKDILHIRNTWFANGVAIVVTFFLMAFSFILFRANTISDAFYAMRHLFDGFSNWRNPQYLYETITSIGVNLFELKVILFAILFLALSEMVSGKRSVYGFFEKKPYVVRMVYYVIVGAFVLLAGVYYNAGEFIYFQF